MTDRTKVPFVIERNENGTFAIIENPESKTYGTLGWLGDKVVRSPFTTRDDARKREYEIAEHLNFEAVELEFKQMYSYFEIEDDEDHGILADCYVTLYDANDNVIERVFLTSQELAISASDTLDKIGYERDPAYEMNT